MEAIHCRQKQVAVLKDLFGKPHQMSVPSLFIYGHTSTGKTLVLNTLLKTMKLPHVIVNCVECYNERFLYEYILNYIAGNFDMMAATADLIKCDNMNDFIRHLKQIVTGLNSETLYIVFDKAEFLRDMEPNILPTFLKLQELTDLNVFVIMVSDIVWEKYRFGTGFCEPFVINFPDYSKEELVEILCLDCPEEYPIGFYNMYANLVLSIFHYACTNLKELKHLVLLNFKHYTQPIKKGEVSITDTKKLWKNIEPHLKKAMSTLYLREVSSCQWENYQYQLETSENASLQGLLNKSHVELPFYSKYLLIAAYLASYNPAKSDRKFFAKHSGKGSRKSQQSKKSERTSNHMLGPKPFPLDRLMAIFYSIVDARVTPTANIFMQVTSLVSLHLLGHAVGEDQIEQPKYKCLVSLDFIKSIARTVNFDVLRYLYDFV
ncbi:origin recognition complex subunit 5-like [Ruditapes philippinarum]|uniref:origin recognition complex subunit 5-like n=1 Tax=Ruditapes philippinarum TaxID=129788 RepID=UPI00295B3D6C|nr:origin recognition complex subunit 5-like [Ruditapes philippinarum]XP_060574505.1 origin recognition complex subunit 5-like [Ruditapes philippinarum]XP_060574506.1 origin recognition complex subunit 5-like [Ruditapes philippinarum]